MKEHRVVSFHITSPLNEICDNVIGGCLHKHYSDYNVFSFVLSEQIEAASFIESVFNYFPSSNLVDIIVVDGCVMSNYVSGKSVDCSDIMIPYVYKSLLETVLSSMVESEENLEPFSDNLLEMINRQQHNYLFIKDSGYDGR